MFDEQRIQRAASEEVLRQMPAAVIVVEAPSGKIVYVNREVQRWTEQILGQPVPQELGVYLDLQESVNFKMLHPDGQAYEMEEWPITRSIKSGEEVRDEEIIHLLGDGTQLWARYDSYPIYDEEGRIVAGVLVSRDITEQKRAEQELRESPNRVESILESITDAFYALDREWRFAYVNERALYFLQRVTGQEWAREELLGQNVWEVFPEAVGTVFYEKYHEAIREQKTVHFEAYSPLANRRRWVEQHVYPSEEGLSIYNRDITERKRAEERLRYHAYLLENVHDAVIAMDEQLLVTAWNKGAQEMYGWRADEVLGRNLFEVVPSDLSEEQRAHALRELSERGRFHTEAMTYGKDGMPVYAEGFTIALREGQQDEEGQITGYVSIRHDISERKRAEEKLKESEERFRLLAENAKDIIYRFRFKPTPGFEYVSPSATSFSGYTPEEHYADPELGLKLVHPEDRHLLEEFLRSPESANKFLTFRWISRDGRIIWTEQQISRFYDAQGDVLAIEGIGRNITERKEMEDALRRSEERFRSLVQNASDIIIILEADGTIRYVSPAITSVLGFRAEVVVGKNVVAFVDPVDRTMAMRIFAEAKQEPGIRPPVEFRLRHEDGTWRHLEINRSNLLDDPAVAGIVLNLRDVTDRKQAEQEIETRTHQQAVVSEIGLWALTNDDLQSLMDDTVAFVAHTLDVEYCKIVELLPSGEELLLRAGAGWEEGIVGQTREGAGIDSQAGYTLLSEEPVIVEDLSTETRFSPSELLREYGVVSSMTVVIAGRGGPFGVLGVHTKDRRTFSEDDVNFLQAVANVLAIRIEREEADKKLEEVREAERSRIARDLHDEALQDLSSALVEAQQVRSISEGPEPASRLGRLVATLKRIGQQLRGAIYDLGLEGEQDRPFSELLESLVRLHRGMAPDSNIHLELAAGVLERPLGKTSREVLRIVGEALTNARRHSGAGNVWVRVRSSEQKLYAEVEDDGRGFEVKEEPSATARGTMGIKGMRERARLLGGKLEIESEPSRGTKVLFELALQKDQEEETDEQGVRVLLVEDHATVRDAVASSFEGEAGFEVVGQAASLAQARTILEEADQRVDVAVVDLGLPDGYGGDLIGKLREKNPQAQALVLSVTVDRSDIARAVEAGAAGILNKTVHLDEVVEAVRRLRAGETIMPPEEVVELLRFAGSERREEYAARQIIDKLTPREKEVLQALAEGLDSEAIARRLHISLRTQRNHMSSILAKLEVHSQPQALVFALRHGVVEIH
jgi:PAS domain S-box-containing protein